MEVNEKSITFDSKRERDVFLELLREVNAGELRPEMHFEAITMLEDIQKALRYVNKV